MEWERGIIVAGMVAAVIAMLTLPVVFAWGVHVGSKGRARRQTRTRLRKQKPYWLM